MFDNIPIIIGEVDMTAISFKNNAMVSINNSFSVVVSPQVIEREKIVQKAMEYTCFPLACDCLNEYTYRIHENSPQHLHNVLERINSIYNQIFSPTPNLNTSSVRHPTFLTDDHQIQQAFAKAHKLFLAYQDAIINEAVKMMPEYFIHKLNLESTDLEIVEKQFYPAVEFLKKESLEAEFATFHDLSVYSFIHYFLCIPETTPNSKTIWMLSYLKKHSLIDESY
jgi:hypothetical protein